MTRVAPISLAFDGTERLALDCVPLDLEAIDRIQAFSTDGGFLGSWERVVEAGSSRSTIEGMFGIAADAAGNAYAFDRGRAAHKFVPTIDRRPDREAPGG